MAEDKEWVSQAERPEGKGRLQYHIRCGEGDVADTILLPGDPDRVAKISSYWDEFREISSYREHVVHTGKFREMDISACSTGAGGPSTSNALEELAAIGGRTFIRVGTTAALQPDIELGDLIISTGSVRFDGTSENYVSLGYPAVAHYEVVLALIEACEKLGFSYHAGITATTASFFCGQNRPAFSGFRQSWQKTRHEDLIAAKVLNYEQEAATLLTLAGLFGLKAGAISVVIANRATDDFVYGGIEKCVQAGNEAAHILHRWNEERLAKNKNRWYPSI